MHPALWISKTGLEAQQLDVSTISNNLANVSTIGFKKDRAVFEDLLYQNFKQAGAQTSQNTELPSGLMLGTGVAVVSTVKDHIQGNLSNTDNPLDWAVNGEGFFQVLQTDGSIAYTRNGQFQLSSTGEIVTSSGQLLQPQITVPTNTESISISQDGIITAMLSGNTTSTQLGQIQLATFVNNAGLQPLGANLYKETTASGTPTINNPQQNQTGAVLQNTLETSNVNVVEELVKLIETQRAYEMNAKAIETVDGMLQFINQVL